MSAATAAAIGINSFRYHPQLQDLFKTAESRYLSEEELEYYSEIIPDQADRAAAAHEVAQTAPAIVKKTVEEIFLLYPYHENHEMAAQKCPRDVNYVSAYATMAMLMNDPKWFDDKLLLWLKTILQAFEFPPRQASEEKKSFFGRRNSGDEAVELIAKQADALPAPRSSIYATYSLLKANYQAALNQPSWELMAPYLQQAIDSLAAE